MATVGGYVCIRFGDKPWERRDEDQWPPLVKRLHRDDGNDVGMRILWYGRGVTEPLHVHDGTHATWVLVGSATMDGETFGPGDLIYGPGGVAHGPLVYEMGCVLFATLNGGAIHTEVTTTNESVISDGLPAHVATEQHLPWTNAVEWGEGAEQKILVNDTARRYVARLVRWPAESSIPRRMPTGSHAGILTKGRATLGDQELGPWDAIYGAAGSAHDPVRLIEHSVMIINSIGEVPT